MQESVVCMHMTTRHSLTAVTVEPHLRDLVGTTRTCDRVPLFKGGRNFQLGKNNQNIVLLEATFYVFHSVR